MCNHSDTFVQIVTDFAQQRAYELETCHECGEELREVVTGEDLSHEWELVRKHGLSESA